MPVLKVNVTDKNIQNLIIIASDKDVLTDNNGNVDVNHYLDAYAVYNAKKDTKKERVYATLEENTESILEYLGLNSDDIIAYQSYSNGDHCLNNLNRLRGMAKKIQEHNLIEDSDEDIEFVFEDGTVPKFKLSWWVNEDAYYETAKLLVDRLTIIDDKCDEDDPFELTNVTSVIVVAEDKSHTLLTMEEVTSFKFKSCDDNMYFVRAEYNR